MRVLDSIRAAPSAKIRSHQPKLQSKLQLIIASLAIIASIIVYFAILFSAVIQTGAMLKNGRYLIIFQNNTELRPTGGFIGSFAILETNNWRPKKFEVQGNIYQADRIFEQQYKIEPPKPLRETWPDGYLALNSSNWSPDFSDSATVITDIFEKSYHQPLDGVIAVNATVIPRILEISGPVNLSSPQLTLTADNFLKEIQQFVERDYYKIPENQQANQPKSVISDVFNGLAGKISLNSLTGIARVATKSIADHDIQFFFKDKAKQAKVITKKWSFEIPEDWPNNYLYVNNANLNGGKGSLGIKQVIEAQIKTSRAGEQEMLVNVTRTNYGRDDGYNVPANRNYTRIYLPSTARIHYLRLDGENIAGSYDEGILLGKKELGFWFTTAVGEAKTAQLAYSFEPLKSKKLLVQHQPGTVDDGIKMAVDGLKVFDGQLKDDKIFDIIGL